MCDCVNHESIVVFAYVPLTCVCQTKSPESEVRGGVRDAAQAVFYGVDGLMHEHVCSIKHLQTAQFKHLHQNHNNASLTRFHLSELSYTGFQFYCTSSSAAPSSTSPWRVLMLPSSTTSGRLSSSWCCTEPDFCQKVHPTVRKGSVQPNTQTHQLISSFLE